MSQSPTGAKEGSLLALAIALGLGAAVALCVAAWVTGLVLYADGALFSFIIGIRESWTLVWHIMPARIAVYLLTVLPAETAHRWGLPAMPAMRFYQALFIGFPFIGLAVSFALTPRGSRWLMVFPTVAVLGLAVSALGFPSEAILTVSAFWPALFGLRYASGRMAPAALTLLCVAAFLFSHPGMVFALPLLPLAAAPRWRESRAPEVRRALLRLGGAGAALLGLWAWRLSVEMSQPGIIQSGQHMWSATGLWEVVSLQPAVVVVLLYIVLWAALGWRRDAAALWVVAPVFPAVALIFWLAHAETVAPESHYYVRTAIVFILPVLGALALWRARSAPNGAIALAMMAALTTTQTLHNLSFLRAWLNYRDSFAASVAAEPARFVLLDRVVAERADPSGPSFAWSWGQPYLSLTLPGLPRYAAIVTDPSPGSFSPARCSQMDRIAARVDWAPAETVALLKAYVCARRPD